MIRAEIHLDRLSPETPPAIRRRLRRCLERTWIAFFSGAEGEDVERLDDALQDRVVMMPPPVLSELLSDPKLSADLEATFREVPLLDTSDGCWARAGRLRATVLARRRKARLGDALIAQSCLDHRLPLLTRDRDFMAFADAAGLDFVVGC